MALKLAAGFKNTTPEFWLTVQDNYDLALAKKTVNTKKINVFLENSGSIVSSKWQYTASLIASCNSLNVSAQ